MSNDDQELIRMANQIADFFSGYPDDEAAAGIKGHIHDFWTPAMRAGLDEIIATGDASLSPLVIRAVRRGAA
ncbi:MAG: formate dehydrogenase subunit delta [Rhodospirillales bacterium]|nr:formate dehydrogenase subunit delta [Rhodospirillales bacterium]